MLLNFKMTKLYRHSLIPVFINQTKRPNQTTGYILQDKNNLISISKYR